MPGPDGTITQAEQVTLVKGRIRYNRAQVRERATELFQALHVLRTLDADAHDAIVADLDPFERRVLGLFEKPGRLARVPSGALGTSGASVRQPRPGGSRRWPPLGRNAHSSAARRSSLRAGELHTVRAADSQIRIHSGREAGTDADLVPDDGAESRQAEGDVPGGRFDMR